MNDLFKQLAPGWSAANIALLVVFYLLFWPLALLMVAYIVWGDKVGVDLSKPSTLSVFAKRLGTAGRAALDSLSNTQPKP